MEPASATMVNSAGALVTTPIAWLTPTGAIDHEAVTPRVSEEETSPSWAVAYEADSVSSGSGAGAVTVVIAHADAAPTMRASSPPPRSSGHTRCLVCVARPFITASP